MNLGWKKSRSHTIIKVCGYSFSSASDDSSLWDLRTDRMIHNARKMRKGVMAKLKRYPLGTFSVAVTLVRC